MNRADLRKLTELRIEEAEVLLKAKKYDGAYYLAGYAVEFGLKACIAKKTRRHDFPDKNFAAKCFSHKVQELVDLADLRAALESDARLTENWAIAKDWTEQSRFERKTRADAQALFSAITDPAHGVLQWIRSRW